MVVSRHDKMDAVLHDGEDNVSLVFDRCESYRCNHHNHEVECLDLVTLDAEGNLNRTYEVHTQLADVDNAFAGARMRKGTISAGYNQVIPSHPIAKNVLKMKRKRAATMPVPLPVYLSCIALSENASPLSLRS